MLAASAVRDNYALKTRQQFGGFFIDFYRKYAYPTSQSLVNRAPAKSSARF
jgi:hypothetical protein